jgi:sensor c-di-GMP phosphodiesterase-like protein
MRAELARAISSRRLSVEYQPFFDTDKHIVVGVEALVRWNNRHEGPLSPAVFVPLAEQMGLLPALTEFVFQRTLEEMGPFLKQYPRMRVSINCHVSTLNDPMLVRFAQQWASAGLESKWLVFEVTERANAHFDADSVKPAMDALKARGTRFAMDDFGVGFSNLNSLRSLPFDFLKIDKTFVDGISSDATDAAGFVTHIVDLAKRLNLVLVAEGVETQAQQDYLRRLGVRYMQGWYFAKAMPADALAQYLREYRVKQPIVAAPQAQRS